MTRAYYLAELARLERAKKEISGEPAPAFSGVEQTVLNPTLRLVEVSWKNLPSLLNGEGLPPEPGREIVMIWVDPVTCLPKVETAADEDLLALKMTAEGLDPKEVAAEGGLPMEAVEAALQRAARKGILLAPRPLIRRDPAIFSRCPGIGEEFLYSPTFTLQWHLTQACDLHCRHCYDRTGRSCMNLGQALSVLEDLRAFCKSRRVSGHISFSGGNPLLYPHFIELYRAAAQMGFGLTILGNPAPRERIEEILAVCKPYFYQVSIEGLAEHNDSIRGEGHFARTERFLGMLRQMGVASMVMLTLTGENINQVIPLAQRLRGLADDFHFNRLSRVGEGANLYLPAKREFVSFLGEYLEAAEENPVMGLKDNLINVIRYRRGMAFFGGCTGYGCGAAFNFMAVLPDGEAHACRKFPSPIGNVLRQSIEEVYDSPAAGRYRAGCQACLPCPIRPVCGGCLASAYSHGLDIFRERDPFCFFGE